MTNTKLLEKAIKDSGLKKSFLAEKVGLTPQGFYNCVNNKAEFRAGQINILCDVLGIVDLEQKEAIFFSDFGG